MGKLEDLTKIYMELDKETLAKLLAWRDLYYVNYAKICPPANFEPNWTSNTADVNSKIFKYKPDTQVVFTAYTTTSTLQEQVDNWLENNKDKFEYLGSKGSSKTNFFD